MEAYDAANDVGWSLIRIGLRNMANETVTPDGDAADEAILNMQDDIQW